MSLFSYYGSQKGGIMNVLKFRTPQEVIERRNVSLENCWLIGIDAGFSSLKGYAPNKCFCFPSYVKKVENMLPLSNEDDILFKDESGTYLVGKTAQEQITSDDTSDADKELFSRNRYLSKKFHIIIMTGIALGLMDNSLLKRKEEVPIKIQTGLPTAYLKKDSSAVKKAFSEDSHFQLKIGSGSWQRFHISLNSDDISVMAQPSGTMYSVMIDENGKYLSDAKSMLMKNLMIVDIGFGTFDPYGLMNRKLVLQESLPDLGMKRILEETTKLIMQEHQEEIRISAMQKILGKGYFTVFDEEKMESKSVLLAPYLEKASKMVCKESIETLKTISNFMRDYDVMIPTGGIGQAWYEEFREHFKGMTGLQIIPGNRNDKLPMIYSNVRGYYMFRYMILKAEKHETAGN